MIHFCFLLLQRPGFPGTQLKQARCVQFACSSRAHSNIAFPIALGISISGHRGTSGVSASRIRPALICLIHIHAYACPFIVCLICCAQSSIVFRAPVVFRSHACPPTVCASATYTNALTSGDQGVVRESLCYARGKPGKEANCRSPHGNSIE